MFHEAFMARRVYMDSCHIFPAHIHVFPVIFEQTRYTGERCSFNTILDRKVFVDFRNPFDGASSHK